MTITPNETFDAKKNKKYVTQGSFFSLGGH